MRELKIEKIENGYILSYEEEVEIDKFITTKEVIEEGDDEKETMARLLHRVAEHFGFYYNKFVNDNLKISWNKKGHKNE
jgi:hypothetical protein